MNVHVCAGRSDLISITSWLIITCIMVHEYGKMLWVYAYWEWERTNKCLYFLFFSFSYITSLAECCIN